MGGLWRWPKGLDQDGRPQSETTLKYGRACGTQDSSDSHSGKYRTLNSEIMQCIMDPEIRPDIFRPFPDARKSSDLLRFDWRPKCRKHGDGIYRKIPNSGCIYWIRYSGDELVQGKVCHGLARVRCG